MRWRGNEILHWGNVTDWEQCETYKRRRLGAAVGERRFESFFGGLFCHCFFYFLAVESVWLYLPAGLHYILHLMMPSSLPQRLMRYAKTSTSFRCHGREPQPEKPSTTSVQQMLSVSDTRLQRESAVVCRLRICSVSQIYLHPSVKTCRTKCGNVVHLHCRAWWEV